MARAVPDEAVGAVVGVVVAVPADDVAVPAEVVAVLPEAVAVDVAFEVACEVEAPAANAPVRARPPAPTRAVNERTRRVLR